MRDYRRAFFRVFWDESRWGKVMRVRVLDLDGSVSAQAGLLHRFGPEVVSLRHWGPRVRMACRWARFRRFERALDRRLVAREDAEPFITFYGSGDFHHVSLALLRRLRGPFNLLVLDKHPDWMRGIPLLHCGTWLYHAARLPQVRNIFHIGGETDFDNAYRWLAPTRLLHSGKLAVFPAIRYFHAGFWQHLAHQPVRPHPANPVDTCQLERLLRPHRASLQAWPLYISVDKDVLIAPQAPVNWDSGHLVTGEVREILRAFRQAANDRLAGVDILGDWSPVVTRGLLRSLLHYTEHPPLQIDPADATRRNQALNLDLAEYLTRHSSADAPILRSAA